MVNGKPQSTISVMDRGFNYGDGVFETILLVNNTPVLLEEHYKRLSGGCDALGISCPDKNALAKQIKELICSDNSDLNRVLKIIITRGESERGYKIAEQNNITIVMQLSQYPEYSKSYWAKGVDVQLCHTRLSGNKKLAGLKHLNRLDQVLARKEWNNEYQEGLMLDESDNIIEGVMSNLFIVEKGQLITPLIERAGVRGIMRDSVLKLCESDGIMFSEDSLSFKRVLSADEVFLTNSLIGVWPVRKIDTQEFTVGTKTITKRIMQLLTTSHLVDYAASAV